MECNIPKYSKIPVKDNAGFQQPRTKRYLYAEYLQVVDVDCNYFEMKIPKAKIDKYKVLMIGVRSNLIDEYSDDDAVDTIRTEVYYNYQSCFQEPPYTCE